MKRKKGLFILLILQFMLFTGISCSNSKQIAEVKNATRVINNNWESNWKSDPNLTTAPNSQNGITFKVDDLSEPKNHLRMQSRNDVLEHLVALSQRNDNRKPSNIVATSYLPENMVNYGFHSFFNGIYSAYMDHRPIVLSPDVIWLLIAQGFSQHVNANAEKLRHHFVNFDGKLTLIVETTSVTLEDPNSPWETIFPQFTQKIAEHTGEELINLLSADFSTTTIVEKVASEITIMETMKAYFEYQVFYVLCGIPEVTLLGTTEDWQKILEKTKQLEKYELGWWTKELEPVLQEFVNASQGKINKKFWLNIFNEKHYSQGSGSASRIDGWIVKFFPYDNNGKRNSLRVIKSSSDLPDEIVKVDLLYYDTVTDVSTSLELWAGFFGLEQNMENFALTPKIGWMIKRADPENSELAKRLEARPRTISIRVIDFPVELHSLRSTYTLNIDFINEIKIPDSFAGKDIRELNLTGQIDRAGINRIKRMFPETRVIINGKRI